MRPSSGDTQATSVPRGHNGCAAKWNSSGDMGKGSEAKKAVEAEGKEAKWDSNVVTREASRAKQQGRQKERQQNGTAMGSQQSKTAGEAHGMGSETERNGSEDKKDRRRKTGDPSLTGE